MGEMTANPEAREPEHGIVRELKSENVAIFRTANRPVYLKFEDVCYKVKLENGNNYSCSCSSQSKPSSKSDEMVILKGITGIVSPGEMLAMLGPSGSGKTTLLTALGGRLISGKLAGNITYNNEPFSSKIQRNTGFVTQDDVLYPTLTVTETLVYTSLLRLPNTLTKAEKKSHAEAVISQLGLTKCKNSIIGGPFLRGVSGGERKRVCIGQEMLINPSLIFLDEPTSGLDSTTAQRIVSTLWDLASGGRTIVMTIHQPSSRLFYMFHKVLLLSEGNPLYFGRGGEICMEYFSSIGYAPTVAMNPSDFLLDLANGIPPDGSPMNQAELKQDLVAAFKSNFAESLKEAVLQESGPNMAPQAIDGKQFARWTTTWWQQFSVLLVRGLKERKHETFSGLKIGQVLVVAVLSGLLWWQSDISNLQDQMGLLFFVSGFWGFLPLFNAIFTFPQERRMLEKERSSGTYRLSSYFMARTMGDSPMELVLPTVFILITYWMGGLKPDASNFFETLFVLLYSVLVSQGLGLALGAIILDQKSATILGSVVMLSFLLAGGYYVQHVPGFIAWIKYLSIPQYTYKLLVQAQYEASDAYPCEGNRTCLVGDFPAIRKLHLGDKAIPVFAMGVMLIGYRIIAYVALTRIGATKK